MITCTRKLWFSSGHRVYGHESVCGHPHGHNYEVHLTAHPLHDRLDPVGRVIDFAVLKKKFDPWLQENWDHAMIFYKKDQEMCRSYLSEEMSGMKHWISPFNPTAEEMAKFLLQVVGPLLLVGTEIQLVKVTLFETPNCWVEASL